MKLLKINSFIKLCFGLLIVSHACATEAALARLHAAVVKDAPTKQHLISVVSSSFGEDDIDERQVIRLERNGKRAFLVPSTNLNAKSPGCYLTILEDPATMTDRILVHKTEGALTCETILAVFACNAPKVGLGVIYGLRLGADKYYAEASFFEVSQEIRLTENTNLSHKMSDTDTAREAKRKLGCQ